MKLSSNLITAALGLLLGVSGPSMGFAPYRSHQPVREPPHKVLSDTAYRKRYTGRRGDLRFARLGANTK